MGKRDRRHSLKMNRLKAQAKKKIRERRPTAVRAEAASALGKIAAAKTTEAAPS